MKKRFFCGILVLALCVSLLTACGDPVLEDYEASEDTLVSDEDDELNNYEYTDSEDESDTDDGNMENALTESEPDDVAAEESEQPFISCDKGKIRDELTVKELTNEMGMGLNISYARIDDSSSYSADDFKKMKKSGFDTVRISVSWTNGMDIESEDYSVSNEFLTGLRAVAEMARGAKLYVIINPDKDNGWWGLFGSSDKKDQKKAKEIYKSICKQTAALFKDYSDYVIFESAGEVLGDGFNDTSYCDKSGGLSDEECYETANELNQIFVSTVRKNGKKNASRFLILSGINGDIVSSLDDRFIIPTDDATGKLLVSVQFYDPISYTLNRTRSEWGTENDFLLMEMKLDQLETFMDKGLGVVISDYGVVPDGNLIKSKTLEYMTAFWDYCDIDGIAPILGDDGKLYNIKAGAFVFRQLGEEALRHSYSQTKKEMDSSDVLSNAKNSISELSKNYLPGVTIDSNKANAWIMYASEDYQVQYCTGNIYDPTVKTGGVIATDKVLDGSSTYRLSLDFTETSKGYAEGVNLLSIGIYMGELYYPGYKIDINEVIIDDEPITVKDKYYTYSEDGITTRMDLYNIFSESVPDDMRTNCDSKKYSSKVIAGKNLGRVHTIEIEFSYEK